MDPIATAAYGMLAAAQRTEAAPRAAFVEQAADPDAGAQASPQPAPPPAAQAEHF